MAGEVDGGLRERVLNAALGRAVRGGRRGRGALGRVRSRRRRRRVDLAQLLGDAVEPLLPLQEAVREARRVEDLDVRHECQVPYLRRALGVVGQVVHQVQNLRTTHE